MYKDLPVVVAATMLPQVNTLPGSESEPTLDDRNVLTGVGQGGADVRWHIISTFCAMPVGAILRYKAAQESLQVYQHIRIRILLDEQAGGGMADEKGTQARMHSCRLDNFAHRTSHRIKCFTCRLQSYELLVMNHTGYRWE